MKNRMQPMATGFQWFFKIYLLIEATGNRTGSKIGQPQLAVWLQSAVSGPVSVFFFGPTDRTFKHYSVLSSTSRLLIQSLLKKMMWLVDMVGGKENVNINNLKFYKHMIYFCIYFPLKQQTNITIRKVKYLSYY